MPDTLHQLRQVVAPQKLKSLHKVSTARGLFSIALEWGLILTTAYLCEKYFSWPLYIAVVIFIGARILALGLIMHESVHQLISKNKLINDVTSELFCAWPLFISMRSYKVKHLAHHKWLNTDLDPDYVAKTDSNWYFPMHPLKFIRILLIQLSGGGVLETFRVMSGAKVKTPKPKTPWWYLPVRLAYYIVIISLFIVWGKGMLLLKYWIVPFVTWTQLANRLRRIAEHSGIPGKDLPLQTRTTKHRFLSELLLAPKNISYHCEHHLFPGIPCYHLPDLHRELTQHDMVKQELYISKTYTGVLRDCLVSNAPK